MKEKTNLVLFDIKQDPENPRVINEDAQNQLNNSIKKFGDISGIVFNIKTQQLVCGHQRLTQLEKIYPELNLKFIDNKYRFFNRDKDLLFNLRVVDWSKEKQMAANLVANSKQAQGFFETNKLDEVLTKYNLDEFKIDFNLDNLRNSAFFNEDEFIPEDNEKIEDKKLKFILTIQLDNYHDYTELKNKISAFKEDINFTIK